MSLALKFGPWIALVVMTGLYLDKRDDLASAIEGFNTQQQAEIAEAERVVREATQRAADERLVEAVRRHEITRNALRDANAAAESARTESGVAMVRIRELELEASIEDIPDSNECLNVFVPSRVLHSADCRETGSGGSGEGSPGSCTEGINPDNPAFATITYADQSRLLMQCRADKRVLNARLEAIRNLE